MLLHSSNMECPILFMHFSAHTVSHKLSCQVLEAKKMEPLQQKTHSPTLKCSLFAVWKAKFKYQFSSSYKFSSKVGDDWPNKNFVAFVSAIRIILCQFCAQNSALKSDSHIKSNFLEIDTKNREMPFYRCFLCAFVRCYFLCVLRILLLRNFSYCFFF